MRRKYTIFCIIATLVASTIGISISSLSTSQSPNEMSGHVAVASYGPTSRVFWDGFETYTIGQFPRVPWYLIFDGAGPSYQYVTDTVKHSGQKSLHMLGVSGWSADAWRNISSSSDTLGYRAWVRSGNLPSNPTHQYAGAKVGFTKRTGPGTADWYASVAFIDDGTIRTPSGIVGNYVANTWYLVEVVLYRPANIYFVFINNSFKGSFLAAENIFRLYQLTSFGLESSWAHMDVYFDDVAVYQAG